MSAFLSIEKFVAKHPKYAVTAAFKFKTIVTEKAKAAGVKSKVKTEVAAKTWDTGHHDWGFWDVATISKLESEERDHYVHDDGCLVVRTRLVRQERYKIGSALSYDSRKETGLLGLENQVCVLFFLKKNISIRVCVCLCSFFFSKKIRFIACVRVCLLFQKKNINETQKIQKNTAMKWIPTKNSTK